MRPLLLLLRCATRPETLDEDAAVELLTSPLGGADVMGLRRLRQVLRRAELDAGGRRPPGRCSSRRSTTPRCWSRCHGRPPGRLPRSPRCSPSPATRSPRREPPPRTCCGRCGSAPGWRPLGAGQPRGRSRRGRPPTATSTPSSRCSRPRPGSATGCPVPAPRSSSTTCSASRSPATSPRSGRSPSEAVQVLTAHASKGLEWDVVCVAGVQEGVWPDLRMRGSFLGSERLVDLLRPGGEPVATAVATAATLGRLLEEERRLFYVAVTRARRALLVTAVTSEREALSPSRFLDEIDPLAGDDPRPLTPVRRPLSLTSLVAELRRSVTDPDVDDDAALRSGLPAGRAGRGRRPRRRPGSPGGGWRRCPTSVRCAAAGESVAREPVEGRDASDAASCGGSSSTSVAATPPAPRRASERWCTPSPRVPAPRRRAPRRPCRPGCRR